RGAHSPWCPTAIERPIEDERGRHRAHNVEDPAHEGPGGIWQQYNAAAGERLPHTGRELTTLRDAGTARRGRAAGGFQVAAAQPRPPVAASAGGGLATQVTGQVVA